jgi:hypothetical protein
MPPRTARGRSHPQSVRNGRTSALAMQRVRRYGQGAWWPSIHPSTVRIGASSGRSGSAAAFAGLGQRSSPCCSARIVCGVEVITSISELPTDAAIYAMYGGDERPDVAYVGMGEKLRLYIRITSPPSRGGSTLRSPTRLPWPRPSPLPSTCLSHGCAAAVGSRQPLRPRQLKSHSAPRWRHSSRASQRAAWS